MTESRIVDIPATQPPWRDTVIELGQGDPVTTFAVSLVYPSTELDIWFGPGFEQWGRVGGRASLPGTRETNTDR